MRAPGYYWVDPGIGLAPEIWLSRKDGAWECTGYELWQTAGIEPREIISGPLKVEDSR